MTSTRRLLLLAVAGALCATGAPPVAAQDRTLGREDIRLLGAGLRVAPARQTVPKDIASIVSTFLQAPTLPDAPLPPFAPDAIVKGTLRGPGFAEPREITARPNTPFNLPPFPVAGLYSLDNIRLESGGEVLLHATPESVTIEVIEKLLVTQVTARPLTAAEIREKGIVFDRSNFQAYNFTAAFAVGSANPVPLSFPVVLPTIEGPADVSLTSVGLDAIPEVPKLPRLETIIPDTLKIQTQIPNLSVVGFTLGVPELRGKSLQVPPIPGIIVIPGDIGFLNQFFNVTLLVGNVAPPGSNLVVSELRAEILLPPGRDRVPNTSDDPLAMARTARGESPRVQLVVQPGADGRLGTADDIGTLAPGESGSAEYLVEGRREGTHVIEMQMTGTLTGLPVGPVTVTGRAAGTVLVRNPTFTLTFTHPDLVNAGEPYTLDVTVTNTSESPANFVSVNLFPANIAGARLVGSPTREVESIPPGDSATVSFDLVSQLTGPVFAATLDSDDNVNGRFALRTTVGELGVPLSPDSLVLPKEARSLPADLRAAALGLLGKAWAVATAPAAALPPDVSRFSKQVVYDRGIELAEAGFRYSLGEPLADSVWQLALDYTGNGFTRIAERSTSAQDRGFREADARGFDELRRASVRGDVLASAMGRLLGEAAREQGTTAWHRHLGEQATWRPAHLSVVVTGDGGAAPVTPVLFDPQGRQLGGRDPRNKVVKQVPFGDIVPLADASGEAGDLLLVALPEPGEYVVRLAPRGDAPVAGTYTVSVVLPDGQGRLRHVVFAGLTATQVPGAVAVAGGTIDLRFELAGAVPVGATRDELIADPAPRVLSVTQYLPGDVITCGESTWFAGRVVAVLFSEEVTRASVQDGFVRGQITAFRPEANEAVGVALQPGRRIAFVAMRDALGPFVARSMTIEGVADRAGTSMVPVTVPMQPTIETEEAGGQVFGRVLYGDGTPAVGVDARLFALLGGCTVGISAKPTDGEGRFAWDFVLKDIYASRLVAVDPRSGDARGLNFTLQRNGQRLEVNVVFLGRGTVAGRALSETGAPLPGTAIRITSLTDRSQYGATADATGAFSVTGVPVGNLLIEAVHVRRTAQGQPQGGAEVTVSEFLPTAGAIVSRDLVLIDDTRRPPTITFGGIAGAVLRGDGATPAQGIPVIAYYRSGSQPGVPCPPSTSGSEECALAVVTTDVNGRFTFEKLPAGQFRVETFDQTTYQQGEARAIVPANGMAAVTVLLDLGIGTVTGVVFDAQGQRVAGARVGGGLSLTTTDANGVFTLTDVPVGRREIVAVSDALLTRGSTIVDLLRAGDTVNATIVLDPTGGIAGTATRANGAPASRAKVYVFYPVDNGVRVIASTETDAQGRYSFSGLALRLDYRVSSFVAGFTEGAITEAPLRFANQVVRADLRFRGQGTVRGRVLRGDGDGGGDTPLAAAVGVSGDQLVVAGGLVGVRFTRVTNFNVTETSLATGRFEFRNVWQGTFTLNAVGEFSPQPVAFEGTLPAAGAIAEVVLRLQATSSVTGVVVLPDGVTPVGAGVQVRLDARAVTVLCGEPDPLGGAGDIGDATCTAVPQGTLRVDAVTDVEGRFTMPIVAAREFTLTATDPASGRIGRLDAHVRPGDIADVTLRLFALPSSVTIRVRTSTLGPVPRALVEVAQEIKRDEDGRVAIFRPRADENGHVVLTGVTSPVEGEFSVLATDLEGGGFSSGRVTGRVRAEDDGRPVTLDVFLYNQAGTVFGRVFRADGITPVANAEVIVSNQSGPLGFAVTDALGAYRVATVPLGPVYVDTFEAATGRRGFAQASLDIDGREVEVNVGQLGVGLVKGRLLQTGDLTPLKGWAVTLSPRLPGRDLPPLLTTSDPDGRFYFPGVAARPFVVAATRRGVAASARVEARLDREGQVVDLPMLVRIDRPQFGRVEGRVVNADATPAAFAQVRIGGFGALAPVTTADALGSFAFPQVPLGQFFVEATPQAGAPQIASAYGELLFENDLATLTLVLSGLATIEGTVVKADGVTPEPFANVFLTGQPFAGCERLSPVTCSPNPDGSPNQRCLERAARGGCQVAADASGVFRFVGISARTFSVVAETASGAVGQVGGALNPSQTLSVRVVLSASTRVAGRVLRSNGEPLGLAVAEFVVPPQVPGQSDRLYVATTADGRFVFDSIRVGGPFALTITDPLGDGVARRSVLSAGGELDLGDIVLDDAPPRVVDTAPAPLATGIPLDAVIRVIFSEPIDLSTVTPANFILAGPAGALPALLTLESGDASVLVDPLVPLAESARYTLVVRDVADRFGKKMPVSFSTSYTAVDLSAPAITQLAPAAGASGVPVTSVVRVQFSEPIDPRAFPGPPVVVSRGGQAITGRTDFLFGNTVIVFTPAFPLVDDTRYDLVVAGAADLAGNRAAPIVTAFTTTDRTPPQLAGLTAPNGGRVIEQTTIEITADATPGHDIAFVDFFVNGVLTFSARTDPFVFPFVAAPAIGGPGAQVLVSAVATDTSGNRGTQPVATVVEIVADDPPRVTITSPADGLAAANNQRVTIEMTATDDVGIVQVGFRAQTGRPADVSTVAVSPPSVTRSQSFAFNMPESAPPGARVPVTVSARDTRGQVRSAEVTLTVTDALAPSVTITGTTSGTRVLPGSEVQVIVRASDAGGIRALAFRASGAAGSDQTRVLDEALPDVAVAFTLSVPAAAAAGQTISLDATATDVAGNVGTAARLALVVADQAPPRLTLTTGNGRLEAVPGTLLTIVASAEDEVGVARITVRGEGAFSFSNGRSFSPALGSVTSPFAVAVPDTAAPGSLLIVTGQAVDLTGNVSDPVTLLLPVRTVSDVTVDSVLMLAGERAAVPVTLGTPAPAGGLTLTFASRNPDIARPVAAVTIPEGARDGVLLLDGVSGGTVQIDVFAQAVLRTTFTATVRGGIVRGLVRGLDGQPAAGVNVSVSNGDEVRSTVTAADGTYLFEGIDRQATVEVRAADVASRLIGFARGPMNRVNGFVVLDITLVEAGRISGTVRGAGGQPAGADVLVRLHRAATGGLVATTFTDAESRYEFPLVELAAYRIDALRPTTGDKGRTTASVDESGQQVTANVTFLGRGTVTGTVRMGGVPMPNAAVTVVAQNVFDTVETRTNADPQGVYRLEGVLAGSVFVSTYDPVTDRFDSARGTIDTHGQQLTLDLTLDDYATLRGQVRRADNVTPVPFAQVWVDGRTVVADENGYYLVPYLRLRPYTIVATDMATVQGFDFYQQPVGGVTGRATVDLTGAGHRAEVTRDVLLLPVGTLLVTVLDGTGQPAANATVWVTTTNTTQGGTQTQGRTARTNAAGLAIVEHVIAGNYSARAAKTTFQSNTLTGALGGGAVVEVTLTLEPTATIAGTLTGPDGATPVPGGIVSLDPYIGFRIAEAGADGGFSFPSLPLGRYVLYGFDASGRLRAVSPEVRLETANEVRSLTLALAGLGAVSGRVTGPATGPGGEPLGEPGVTVTLQSFAPSIGGVYSATTNAAGFYVIPNVVAGPFRLSVFDTARQLAAEATGAIPASGGDVGIDLALVSNSVTMATTWFDANGRSYDVRNGAELREGQEDRFRNVLDVVVEGAVTRFTGAQFGTQEDGGRERAVRQTIGPLSITRKVYTPVLYFGRYLETFTNTGSAPVTFDAIVTSRLTRSTVPSTPPARATSSGDAAFAVGGSAPDRYLVTMTDGSPAIVPNGTNRTNYVWAFDGEGAALNASVGAIDDQPGSVSEYRFGWTLTLRPGETASLLHFTSVTPSQAAGVGTAERLLQLPPEALQGLSAIELQSIRNFAVPANGISTLEPLPALDGTVAGRVFEFDGTTPTPAAGISGAPAASAVRFRSALPYFAWWRTTAIEGTAGAYTVASKLDGTFNNVAVPAAPFDVEAVHPWTGVVSPTARGTFAPGQSATTQDIVFANTSLANGTVRRHTGTAVTATPTSVTLTRTVPSALTIANVPVDSATGTYRVFGVPGGTYSFTATSTLPTGGTLTGSVPVDVIAGQATAQDITLTATGTITGTLTYFGGGAAPAGREVRLGTVSGSGSLTTLRTAVVGTAGQFTFPEVPVGTWAIEATDTRPPGSGFTKRETGVPVSADQTTIRNIVYWGPGTITGVLSDMNGNPVPAGRTVSLYRGQTLAGAVSGSRVDVTTTAGGVFTFTNLFPFTSGQSADFTYNLNALDPSTSIRTEVRGIVVGEGQTIVRNLQYLALGSVTGVTRRAVSGGAPVPVGGATVQVRQGNTIVRSTTSSTAASTRGAFTLSNLAPGSYTLRGIDPDNGAVVDTPVTVTAGQPTVQDILFALGGSIQVLVTYDGTSTPVSVPAFIRSCPGASCWPSTFRGTTTNGALTISNQAPGSHVVRAEHGENSRNEATASVTISDPDTPAVVTLSLAPVGSLTVTVVDADDTPVANSYVAVSMRNAAGATAADAAETDASGRSTFTEVFGTYTVEAALPGSYELIARATGRIEAEGAASAITVRLPRSVRLTGRVLRADGTPDPSAYLDIMTGDRFRANAGTGPGGAFAVPAVPVGQRGVIHAYGEDGDVGLLEFTIPQGSTGPFDVTVRLDDVSLPAQVTDGNGRRVEIAPNGQLKPPVDDGGLDQQGRSLLLARQREIQGSGVSHGIARRAMEGRELHLIGRFSDTVAPGLWQTRRIYVPADGYFVRILDVLENVSSQPITVDLLLQGWSVLAYGQGATATSSGDADLTAVDRWIVMEGLFLPVARLMQVFAGPGAQAPTTSDLAAGTIVHTWSAVTIPPGGRVALLSFAGEHGDLTFAQAAAERLVQLPPEALAGLTDGDRAAIINFVVPVQSAAAAFPSISGRVTLDGSTPVDGALVAVVAPNLFRELPGSAVANAMGDYVLRYPVAAGYEITAAHPETQALSAPVTGTRSPGQTTIVADLSFANVPPGTLTGLVVGEGVAVSGATVTLQRPGLADRVTTSQPGGRYTFVDVPPALNYSVSASSGGVVSGPVTGVRVASAATAVRDLLLLTRQGQLTVRTVNAWQQPLAGATVQVVDVASGLVIGEGVTDEQGEVTFTLAHAHQGVSVAARWTGIWGETVVGTGDGGFLAPGVGQAASIAVILGDSGGEPDPLVP